MADLNPYTHGDSSGGMVSGINENIRPQNTVDLAVNLDFDYEIGSAVSRLGTGLVGAQLVDDSNQVLGLHQHIDSANSSNNLLFGAINASGDATLDRDWETRFTAKSTVF